MGRDEDGGRGEFRDEMWTFWGEMVKPEASWALWTMDIVDLMDTVDMDKMKGIFCLVIGGRHNCPGPLCPPSPYCPLSTLR